MSDAAGATDVRYVGFWARLAAAGVDIVALLFVVVPVTLYIFGDGWAYTEGAFALVVNWVVPGAALDRKSTRLNSSH